MATTAVPMTAAARLCAGGGFVDAMRVTLWLPIAVLAVGALSVLLVKGRKKGECRGGGKD